MTPRDAEKSAAAALAALSDRMSRAAASLARMVARLATEDNPSMSISFAKYMNAGMPEAEAVKDVAAMLEGALPLQEQVRRAKARRESQRQKLEWQISTGRFADADVPSWGRDMVLQEARRRRDVMGAAIAACEQRKDSDEVLSALAQHLAGRDSLSMVEAVLHRAGLTVEAGNVVPFIPQRRHP